MKQKGGILIKDTLFRDLNVKLTEDSAINYFIDNSIISLLSNKTHGGILFKLTLQDGVESPYYSFSSNNVRNYITNEDRSVLELRTIILKVVAICDNVTTYTDFTVNVSINRKMYNSIFYHTDNNILKIDRETTLYMVDTNNFNKEIEIQKDIYSKSYNEDLEPLCPEIIHSYVKPISQCQSDLEKLLKKNLLINKAYVLLKYLIGYSVFTKVEPSRFVNGVDNYKFGFIFMENIQNVTKTKNVDVMWNHYNEITFKDTLIYNYWYEIYRFYQLGYLHGDPHLGNCLYDPDYGNYVTGTGRAMLIDFGRSEKVLNKLNYLVTKRDGDVNNTPIPKYQIELRQLDIPPFNDVTALDTNESTSIKLYESLLDPSCITDVFTKKFTLKDDQHTEINYGILLCLYHEYYENILKNKEYSSLSNEQQKLYNICKYFFPILIEASIFCKIYDSNIISQDGPYEWLSMMFDYNKAEHCINFVNLREIEKASFLNFISSSKYENIATIIESLNVSFANTRTKYVGMENLALKHHQERQQKYLQLRDIKKDIISNNFALRRFLESTSPSTSESTFTPTKKQKSKTPSKLKVSMSEPKLKTTRTIRTPRKSIKPKRYTPPFAKTTKNKKQKTTNVSKLKMSMSEPRLEIRDNLPSNTRKSALPSRKIIIKIKK